MTNYNLKPIIPPSLAAKAKKAARKKLLEKVRARRKGIYAQYRKRREEANNDLEEQGDY